MNNITIHHQDGEYDVTAQQDHTPDRDANMSWTFSEFTAARDFASNYLSLMNTTSFDHLNPVMTAAAYPLSQN